MRKTLRKSGSQVPIINVVSGPKTYLCKKRKKRRSLYSLWEVYGPGQDHPVLDDGTTKILYTSILYVFALRKLRGGGEDEDAHHGRKPELRPSFAAGVFYTCISYNVYGARIVGVRFRGPTPFDRRRGGSSPGISAERFTVRRSRSHPSWSGASLPPVIHPLPDTHTLTPIQRQWNECNPLPLADRVWWYKNQFESRGPAGQCRCLFIFGLLCSSKPCALYCI